MSGGDAGAGAGYRARREIERLIYRYAELQDAADWDALAAMFAHAAFEADSGASWSGAELAERRRANVVTRGDGTPRTRHVTTNVVIEVDAARGRATAESCYTILQGPPALPLQPIASGRYHDRFERTDGAWRFAHRRSALDLRGRLDAFRRSG